MSKQAPQFRPRQTKAQTRSRRYLLAASVIGVLLIAAIGTIIGLAVSGDDSNSSGTSGLPTAISRSTGGTEGGPEPRISAPAARYVIQAGDVPNGFKTLGNSTFNISSLGFATNGTFKTSAEGEQAATDWGYADGYQSSFEPQGQLADVVKGAYYIKVESYIFNDSAGAAKAITAMETVYRAKPGSTQETAKGLGNQSSAWKLINGTVGTSELVQVYHRFIFRRGNLVTVVQTTGADVFVNIDKARDLAVIVDRKALGEIAAPTPTISKSGTPALPPVQPTQKP